MTTSDLDPDALADWADEKAREVADNNRLICGPCGAPLPSPECGHPELGVIGCCIAAGDSNIEAAIAAALREAEQRGQETMRKAVCKLPNANVYAVHLVSVEAVRALSPTTASATTGEVGRGIPRDDVHGPQGGKWK